VVSACEECGFDPALAHAAGIAPELAGRFAATVATSAPDVLARRPAPGVWSPTEYLAHVRDVLLVQRERVVLARVEERPSFARMYRDERVAICGYGAFGAPAVLQQLQMAGELCAAAFASIEGAAWQRRLVYNWPAPAERDLAWLARHTLHEGVHHLFDIERIVSGAGSTPDGRQAG